MAAGKSAKKRLRDDARNVGSSRPPKKQRKQTENDSESTDDEQNTSLGNFPVESEDEDFENMIADDGASSDQEEFSSGDDSDRDDAIERVNPKAKAAKKLLHKPTVQDAPSSPNGVEDPEKEEISGDDSEAHSDSQSDQEGRLTNRRRAKQAKRRPTTDEAAAFATSLTKILGTKLPTSRRADPIVFRSASSAQASRSVADAALEAKARRRLREQTRLAMEKGRVRDVLIPSRTRELNIATGEVEERVDKQTETAGQIMDAERRLRKTAQRGVVRLFNAFRSAQAKAAEAQREARREGVVGMKKKEEAVVEMTKKGFLALIAGGSGESKKKGARGA